MNDGDADGTAEVGADVSCMRRPVTRRAYGKLEPRGGSADPCAPNCRNIPDLRRNPDLSEDYRMEAPEFTARTDNAQSRRTRCIPRSSSLLVVIAIIAILRGYPVSRVRPKLREKAQGRDRLPAYPIPNRSIRRSKCTLRTTTRRCRWPMGPQGTATGGARPWEANGGGLPERDGGREACGWMYYCDFEGGASGANNTISIRRRERCIPTSRAPVVYVCPSDGTHERNSYAYNGVAFAVSRRPDSAGYISA